jgi:hypothetical protein
VPKRYTAIIDIVEIEETPAVATRYDHTGTPATKEKREVAKLVVRGETLEELKKKLMAHISLV